MDRELLCPLCRVVLQRENDGLRCQTCSRHFPVVAGILDLRVEGDAYLSIEDDREKALALAAVPGRFEDVVHAYWARTPEVPTRLAAQYAQHMLDGPCRAAAYLRRAGVSRGTLLDVGCGTGGLLVAAAAAGMHPVGVDIALRWLVVAARALHDRGVTADLVAADGALLPFRKESFDVVTCIETLEHARDPRALLHSCLAAAGPAGSAHVIAANRFSLAPEPSVRLWGVGWLPRRLAIGYVARRRHTRYQHVRPTSVGELRAFLGPRTSAIVRPAPLPAASATAPWFRRTAGRAADAAIRLAPAALVGRVAPFLEVTAK